MKLSHIPNTLIQLLRPRVIRSTDTLSTALERKKGALSFQSAEKLVRIANADVSCGADLRLGSHFQELSHLEAGGDTAFCVRAADMPLTSAAFAIEKVLNAAEVHLVASARPSLDRHLTTFLKDVEVTQSRWTDLYWAHYNPALAADDQNGISGRAAKCLGVAPDPGTQQNDLDNDTSLLDIFKRMASTQESKLPSEALDVLDAAFVRLHSVNAIEDPAAYGKSPCLASNLHTEADFINLPGTQRVLQDIRALVGTVQKPTVKAQLLAKLDRFDARVTAGVSYCLGARQALLDGGAVDQKSRDKLQKFDAWLGALKDDAAQRVEVGDAAQVPEQVLAAEHPTPSESSTVTESPLFVAVASLFLSSSSFALKEAPRKYLDDEFKKAYGVERSDAMRKGGDSNAAGGSLSSEEREAIVKDIDAIEHWLDNADMRGTLKDTVSFWLCETLAGIEGTEQED